MAGSPRPTSHGGGDGGGKDSERTPASSNDPKNTRESAGVVGGTPLEIMCGCKLTKGSNPFLSAELDVILKVLASRLLGVARGAAKQDAR